MGQIEERADKQDRGSVWRACLAIQRSCENDALGKLVVELGYGYCMGRDTLKHLKGICDDHLHDSKGEFHQAVQALQNAVEMAPKEKKVIRSNVDQREGLWFRLDRLVK
jgi:hypothetical protein